MNPTNFLNYETLRQQGIAWLEKLAGFEWTDFNAHDPGITILEQLCYALTDLSYRINYDMADLLSQDGEDTYASLYRPEQILVTNPVTLLDLRKLVIDIEGVKNVWLEPVADPQPAIFVVENTDVGESKTFNLKVAEGTSEMVLQGIYRVFLEKSPDRDDKDDSVLKQTVSECLHAQRCLAIDYETITILPNQYIQFEASIEIDSAADPDEVYLGILGKLVAYVSPSVRFYTLEECLAQGKPIAEIFDGPLLKHGFIDSQELAQLKKRTNLYGSDLIREIMDVSGVRMVEYVVFKTAEDSGWQDTALALNNKQTPKLDVSNTKLTLKNRQLPLKLLDDNLKISFQARQKQAAPPLVNATLPLPPGRDRHTARYYSLLQQFPTVYGIGETGLPSNASEQRKAESKQLKAYLLFFDQLLANSFTQLAHVRDLFSFDNDQTATYFAATLDDPGIAELWLEQNNDNRQAQLQEIFGSSATGLSDGQLTAAADWQRKNRFLDHLLARFAEQFTDYSSFSNADGVSQETSENNGIAQVKKTLLSSKLELLSAYDRLSRSRGSGYNILAASDENNGSVLEQLLMLKLGILPEEKLYVIEHIFLRPIPDDTLQNELPVLRNAFSQDPYSLQLTVLLFVSDSRRSAIEHFVEQTVRDETPAHLMVYLSWRSLEDKDAAGFYKIYDNWQHQLMAYRKWLLNGATGKFDSFPLRVYRDHLIDWLGIGETNPLRDLVVTVTSIVDYEGTASIKLQNTEAQLFYQGFTRSIADQDFVHGATDAPTFTIPVPDKKEVTLLTQAPTSGFGSATDAVEGQLGSDLELTINNKLTEDSFATVQAFKMDSAKVQSTIGFTQVTAVLVRPNPNPDLHLIPSSIKRSVLQAPIQVTGGDPGVFYEFTDTKYNTVLGLPVYFPHPDSVNNIRNVGIGQVQVEVDLVVAVDGSAAPQLSDNVTLKSDAVLSIRAYKAQSGVEVIFTRNVSDLLINPK